MERKTSGGPPCLVPLTKHTVDLRHYSLHLPDLSLHPLRHRYAMLLSIMDNPSMRGYTTDHQLVSKWHPP